MNFLISVFIIIISILIGAFIGFIIPFLIAQFDDNPAWGFIPMITIPIGVGIGPIIGIIIIIRKFFS